MSFPNNEQWLFVVEWFDPQPQMKKQFLLKYFLEQHSVEMIDIKSKKVFLKKSPCPPEVTSSDFFVGGILLLYSRELTIVDFGDLTTRSKFATATQRVVAILPAEIYSQWGNAISDFEEIFRLIKIRSYIFPDSVASSICDVLGINARNVRALTAGTSLALVLDGEAGYDRVSDISARYGNTLFVTTSGLQTNDLLGVFAAGFLSDTATLDSCTCVVIKPHAIKSKSTGKIINHIISQGYEISAMASRHLERVQAEEVLEVYKGVLPDFSDQVTQLCSGMCVAMEVRAERPVATFRATAGPWDIEFAKQLRPSSIRAIYGVDKVRNAVHCTDLESDGASECEYFLKLLDEVAVASTPRSP